MEPSLWSTKVASPTVRVRTQQHPAVAVDRLVDVHDLLVDVQRGGQLRNAGLDVTQRLATADQLVDAAVGVFVQLQVSQRGTGCGSAGHAALVERAQKDPSCDESSARQQPARPWTIDPFVSNDHHESE